MPSLPSLRSQPGAPSLFRIVLGNGLPIFVAFSCFVAAVVGWMMFAFRLDMRADLGRSRAEAVEQIWGGPLAQPHPSVQWRRTDASTASLTPGELTKTTIVAELATQHRRRGVTEVPAYELSFSADYEFINPSSDPSWVAFSIPLPARPEVLMLQEVRLSIDGHERREQTEYSADAVTWTGRVDGGARTLVRVQYRARGLGRFTYALQGEAEREGARPFRPITGFDFKLKVSGARGALDYPVGSMSPTDVADVDGAKVLTWKVDRLLTAFGLGVVLPSTEGTEAQLNRLLAGTPWFFVLFLTGLFFALAGLHPRAKAVHLLALSGAYFLYLPLATYLAIFLPVALAFGLSIVALGALSVLHGARFIGARAGALVGTSAALFMGVPALAYLLPTKNGGGAVTGLVLVLGAVVALAVVMQLLGRLARRVDEAAEPTSGAPLKQPIIIPEAT